MTKVCINSGSCGFISLVEVEKKDRQACLLKITSPCEMVTKLGNEIEELTMADAFSPFPANSVYKKAAMCLRHVACPVPSGILKALEVELGLNVPRNSTIQFVEKEERED